MMLNAPVRLDKAKAGPDRLNLGITSLYLRLRMAALLNAVLLSDRLSLAVMEIIHNGHDPSLMVSIWRR